MDLPELQTIIKITTYMNEYQRNNNIKVMCSANTSLLYNFINDNYPNLKKRTKVSAIICHYLKKMGEGHQPHFHIHLVVSIDEKKLIDPSYEIDSMTDVLYLSDLKAFQKCCYELEGMIGNNFKYPINEKKNIIKTYLDFVNIANKINEGNEMTSDKEYSDNIMDYVNNKYNENHNFNHLQIK
jgi:hypothetical protein